MAFSLWRKRYYSPTILYFLTLFFSFWIIYNLQNKYGAHYYYKEFNYSSESLYKIRHRDGFQKVSENFWIYSAYHVYNQTNGYVKIIVLGIYLNTRIKSCAELKVLCRIQNGHNFDDFFLTFGEFKLIEENDRKYNAVQVVCKISKEMTQNLTNFNWISIMPKLSKSDQNFQNFLPIQYNPRYLTQFEENEERNFEFKYNLSLCIRPTFNFDNFGDFIEFIEIYRLIGVDHFTLYNHSIGPTISCLLNTLNYQNFISIVPWTDPLDLDPFSLKSIFQKGQIIAQTDCLYGYRGLSKFVGFVDFDEFILPRKRKYQNLYKFLTKKFENLEEIAEFRFKNSFFTQPTIESHDNDGILKNLKIPNWTKRTAITRWCGRTKFIVQPEKVSVIRVHFAQELIGQSINVSSNLAFLHHYRRPDGDLGHEIRMTLKNLTDNYPRNKFGVKLTSKVQSIVKNVYKNCLKLD